MFAAVGGALFGFSGIIALSAALTVLLAESLGTVGAITTVAVIFLTIACGCLYFFLLPHRPIDEEVEKIEDVGANAISQLPMDTLKHFVKNQPLTSAAIALTAGYCLIRDPDGATKHAQKLLFKLL
ncbi:MAG: hypothetical protein AAF603_05935 [Pseudomonadota bacterium]